MGFVRNGKPDQDRVPDRQRLLTLPLSLEEGRAPRLVSSILYLASAFVVAAIAWATITQIRELAFATGEVKPTGSVKLVQHLEGGMVAAMLASEGQVVEKGAPIVRLQPVAASADLGQMQVRAAGLRLRRERLSAAIEKRDPDFAADGRKYPQLAREQLEVMRTSIAQQTRERETLLSRLSERKAEVRALKAQVSNLARQLAIQKERVEIRSKLLEDGFVSRAAYLEAKSVLEKTIANQIAMTGRLEVSRDAVREARNALRELDGKSRLAMTDERAKVAAELAEVEETITKRTDRVARLLVRAPVSGVIQEIVPKSVGEVMKPGDVIARIVPMNQELIAEVRVDPRDIGYIKVGDPAEVKVTTYDPAKFGGIPGTVRQISATTFQTERGEPYYKAVIRLKKNHVGVNEKTHLVLPGMVVQAEIITGAKSLTQYLLKPVYRSLNTAFSER